MDMARWSRSDLKRPGTALGVAVSFVFAVALATSAACNIHELAHAVTGTVLGWEVERVNLCLPAGGSVEYAFVGDWAGNLQGYAGGLVAAAVLVAIYVFVFARPERPLVSPNWWAAGLGLVVPVGPQLTMGLLEGAVSPGEDYTIRYSTAIPILVALSMVVVVIAYVWRWRAVGKPS